MIVEFEPLHRDDGVAQLEAMLADFEASLPSTSLEQDGIGGILDVISRTLEDAAEAGVPGAEEAKNKFDTVTGRKRKAKKRQQRRQEAQRQELEKARRDKAVREAEDRADAKAEQQERLQRNRIRLLEDALKDRVAQVTQLVQERERIRARIAELEAQETGWSTETKVVAGLASIGTLITVLKLLSDRGQ